MGKKTNTVKLLLSAIASAVAAVAVADNVIWVDCKNGIDSAGRGSAESAPLKTIQYAVDMAAASGSEIRVKPGVYGEGGKNFESWNNRIVIKDKVVKIVSTGGKHVTHITGSGERRCIFFSNAAGSVVEGFTIRDGKVPTTDSGQVTASGAAAIGLTSGRGWSKAQGCIVDCVVSNCVGYRGGAFRGLTVVRSWITENSAANSGDAGRGVDFLNCLITRNCGSHSSVYEDCKLVNCTVADNKKLAQSVTLYNSVVLGNGEGSESNISLCTLINSVARGGDFTAGQFQFVAPLYGDYRVLKGSEAESAGMSSNIGSAGLNIPPGVETMKDIAGEDIREDGAIAAGCHQTVIDPEGGGVVFNSDTAFYAGGVKPYATGSYAFAESWPTQFTVQAASKGETPIFCYIVNNGSGDRYLFPTLDDTAHIAPPQAKGVTSSVKIQNSKGTYYVDAVGGSDATANGRNPATPFKSLQKAFDAYCEATSSAFGYVIRAAAGDYKEGGAHQADINNRLVLKGNGIRIVGAGAGKSVIWGEPDPDTKGMGIGATRCIYSVANRACVQGFTIRDGYADGSSSGDAHSQRGGGVYMNATGKRNVSLHILDCVITNCHAYRGAAGYSGAYERCRITDCRANAGVMRYATLVSSIVENVPSGELSDRGLNNAYGLALNTLFVGRNTDEYVVGSSGTVMTNCIVVNVKELGNTLVAGNSIAWNVPSFNVAEGMKYENPKFADMAEGDYRPIAYWCRNGTPSPSSPALGAGTWYDLGDSDGLTLFNFTDYDGKSFNLAGGKPTIGAYQWPKLVKETQGVYLFMR
jgi:hypothetical protein